MIRTVLGAAGLAIALVGSASAATLGITEGARDLVGGTTKVAGSDVPSNPLGYSLGTVGTGSGEFEEIDIHGRIVSAADTYSFFSSKAFRVDFIFGPVALHNGGTINGGFAALGGTDNKSEFEISFGTGGGVTKTFKTDILSIADNGGTSFIFGGGATPGSPHVLQIDNRNTNPSGAATYDLKISVVPLPAAGGMLLLAIGGLGLAGRRKKA